MSVALKWLGSVASVIACAGMVLFVVTAWFLLNAGHGCTRVSDVAALPIPLRGMF